MKVFVVVICAVVVGLVSAEAPNAPYPPSGWKPQGSRLELPTEYGAPVQEQKKHYEVEITKENVEYAGQLGETTTDQPSNEYLPPGGEGEQEDEAAANDNEDQDPLSVQGLPNRDQARNFNNRPQQPSQNQRNGQFRRVPARFQAANQFNQRQPAFRPQFGRIEQEQPPQQYGPPPTTEAAAVPDVEDQPSDEEVEDQPPTIAVANAGQYYILSPENTLQRVMFLTTQTEDDRKTNGYTAQLKYAPVEPIRDPVYAYNDQGQLVRVYNKK